jgi:hypothetical protein
MFLRWTVPAIMVFTLVTACSRPEVKPEPVAPPVVKQEPVKPGPSPKKVHTPPPLPPVVILVSEPIPAYQQVAEELEKLLPRRSTIVYLSPEAKARTQLSPHLKNPEYQQFVAIGLSAATEAKALTGSEDELIFCQVFNYQEYDLVGPRAKGVGSLPGTAAMFSTWSKMSPALKSVGVVTGPGLEEVIAAASSEASSYGIQLHHRVVNTDKEMLFEYKQMAPLLQGLWLLPDNRVLSGRIIKEVMSFSVRNSKQVAVFNDDILRLGGLLSVTTRPEEIAAKVVQRLQEASKGKGVPGPDLLLLQEGDIQVNAIVAKRYNVNHVGK